MFHVKPQDNYYMQKALELARLGEYSTRPNPCVGCVLVLDEVIIGEGFHAKAGTNHAEVMALAQAKQAQGATAYVSLEPCAHTGRTPPCADALINAGVRRVVVACLDPNPLVAGKGVQKLRNAGIEVSLGVCHDEAYALNVGFMCAMQQNRPYVRLKIACSIDGRIALGGRSQWLTGEMARLDVQAWRARSGAIITGSQTIIDDDPKLDVRLSWQDLPRFVPSGVDCEKMSVADNFVVVVDRRKRLDSTSPYQVCARPSTLFWRENLDVLLMQLQTMQVRDVLVEAGGALSGAFLQNNLVDELIVYQAPCFLGIKGVPMADFALDDFMQKKQFELLDVHTFGDDVRIRYQKIES